MGGENSRPERKKEESSDDRLRTELAIQQALQQQRKLYEKKCEKLLEAQSKSLQQNNVNKSNTTNVTLKTSSSNLYPNVQCVTQRTHVVTNIDVGSSLQTRVNQPSVSQGQYQVILNQAMPQNPSSSTSATVYPKVHIHLHKSQSPQPPPIPPQPQPLVTNNNMQTKPNVNKSSPIIEFQFSPSAPSAPEAPEEEVNENPKVSHTGARPKSRFSPSAPSAPEAPAEEVNENPKVSHTGARPKSRTRPQSKSNNETQLVNCVTCSRPLESYIYNCQKGHSSCTTCRTSKKPCGICSSLIMDMRNITLETTIAENNMFSRNNIVTKKNYEARIRCLNAKHGCCLYFTKEVLESHLKECPFKDLMCPFSKKNNCNWKGKINQLSVHLKEVHPANCEANVDTELTLTNDPSDPYVQEIVHYVPMGPFNFLIHIKRDIQKTIYMTVQLYGTKVSASKWTYEFHIYNKKTPRRKFQYTDTCHSDTTLVQDLFDAGQCAVVPMKYAKTFLDNNNLTYKFYLKKDIDLKKNHSSQNTVTTQQ